MCGLHRLLRHGQQVLAQLVQVHFLAQGGAESCNSLGGIILATVASTVASMMPPRLLQLSAPPCARKWTWTSCASTCWPWRRRRCSPHMSHCGCLHLHTLENSELPGEPTLLFPLRANEEVKGSIFSLLR